MRYGLTLLSILMVGLVAGCRGDVGTNDGDGGDGTGSDAGDTGSDGDGDSDSDADGDSDADSDADADADADGDADPDVTVCGGSAGDTCGEDEYCAYVERERCGETGQTSICEPRPTMCSLVYDPVCGCDGNTYDNWCQAAVEGWGYESHGECD